MKTKAIKSWLKHAFYIEKDFEIDTKDIKLLDKMSDWLVKRELGVAAIMLLETSRPLNFISSQALGFLRPFVKMVFKKAEEFNRFGALLENRQSISCLIESIENKMSTSITATSNQNTKDKTDG